MAEVYLYQDINAYSAQQFAMDMAAANAVDGSAQIKICGRGGSPEYTSAMLATLRDFPGKADIEVTGMAYSMHAFFPAFIKGKGKIKSVSTAKFLIHRAGYDEWLEMWPSFMDAGTVKNLNDINSDLKAALKDTIDVAKLEEIAQKTYPGLKFNEIFALTDKNGAYNRPDIFLTAKEAKAIGLVDEVMDVNPELAASFIKQFATAQAHYAAGLPKPITPTPTAAKPEAITAQKTTKHMTLDELKKDHSDVFAAAAKEGADSEAQRIAGWRAWEATDAVAVKAGIDSGKDITPSEISVFTQKMVSKAQLKVIETESAATVTTEEDTSTAVAATKETAEYKAFRAEVEAGLGLKKS